MSKSAKPSAKGSASAPTTAAENDYEDEEFESYDDDFDNDEEPAQPKSTAVQPTTILLAKGALLSSVKPADPPQLAAPSFSASEAKKASSRFGL